MGRLRWVVAVVAIAAAGFLGVIGGNWYLGHRQRQHYENKVGGLTAGTSTALREGQPFPTVSLVGLDGNPTTTAAVINGRGALVFFVSLGCDVCAEAVQDWIGPLAEFPSELAVFGVADREYEYVRVYAEKQGFPFPLYCDEVDAFGSDYDMDVYPTAVGVDEAGNIVFVKHGFERSFTIDQAFSLLGNQ